MQPVIRGVQPRHSVDAVISRHNIMLRGGQDIRRSLRVPYDKQFAAAMPECEALRYLGEGLSQPRSVGTAVV